MGIRRRIGHLCTALCAMVQSLAVSHCLAAEWSMEPSIDLRTEYNTNIAFVTAPHPSVWGIIPSPDAKFSGTTETLDVTGELRLNFNTYYGESGLDATDVIFGVRSSYKATERDTLGLNVDAVRDSTLNSELAQTGVVLTRDQRSRFTANPSWSRSLTETTAIGATYSYNDVRYANAAQNGLIDYIDQPATFGVQSKLSEHDILGIGAYFDRYETAQSLDKTYGVALRYDRSFSETLDGRLLAGVRWTRSTVFSQALVCDAPIIFGSCSGNLVPLASTTSTTSTGFIFDAFLNKKWETGAISGEISQQVYPSGLGGLVQTDTLGVTWTEQWAPTVTSSVAGSIYGTRNVGNVVPNSNSRYVTIDSKVSWKMTEWWTLSAGYTYSHAKYQDNPAQASANIAYVVLSYAWPKLSVSR